LAVGYITVAITITRTAIGAQDIVTGMILIEEALGASLVTETARVLMEVGRGGWPWEQGEFRSVTLGACM